MKRLLSILLSLTLVFSLSAAAGAETAEATVVQTQVLVIGGRRSRYLCGDRGC